MKLTRAEEKLIAHKRRQAEARDKAKKAHRAARRGEKVKRGRELDAGYLAYLRRLPCVACMIEGGNCGPTEAAHLRFSDASLGRINPGLQCKPSDRWATPLGHGHHHHDQHKRAERVFWERLGVEPGALSMALHAAYLAGADGLPILQQFTSRRAA